MKIFNNFVRQNVVKHLWQIPDPVGNGGNFGVGMTGDSGADGSLARSDIEMR